MEDDDTIVNVVVCALVNLAIHIANDIDLVNPATMFANGKEYKTAITIVNTLKALDEELHLIEEWLAKPKHVDNYIELAIQKQQEKNTHS